MYCRKLILAILGLILLPLVVASHCAPHEDNFAIKVSLTPGSITTRYVDVTSEKGGIITLNLVNQSLPGVTLETSEVALGPGEIKNILILFNASNLEPGVYVGVIESKENDNIAYTPIIFEVETPTVLFHANLNIPPIYTTRAPGEPLVFEGTLYDVAHPAPTEVHQLTIRYVLYSDRGVLIHEEEERILLTDTTRFTKSFPLPDTISCDTYVVGTIIKNSNSVGVSTRTFTVANEKTKTDIPTVALFILSAFILITAIIYFLFSKIKQ